MCERQRVCERERGVLGERERKRERERGGDRCEVADEEVAEVEDNLAQLPASVF